MAPRKPQGVDLLIVVDNSSSMPDAQGWFSSSVAALVSGLEQIPGGTEIRAGVVSTDLGVGPYAFDECSKSGDGGKLTLIDGCPSPTGGVAYVQSKGKSSTAGVPLSNALACMVWLGELVARVRAAF